MILEMDRHRVGLLTAVFLFSLCAISLIPLICALAFEMQMIVPNAYAVDGFNKFSDHSYRKVPLRSKLATEIFIHDSEVLCQHVSCRYGTSYYDPAIEKCRCSWADELLMKGFSETHQNLCGDKVDCHEPFNAVWDQNQLACACSIKTLPFWGDDVNTIFEPKDMPLYRDISRKLWAVIGLPTSLSQLVLTEISHDDYERPIIFRRQEPSPTGAIPQNPVATYIPPPKTDVTAQLIQQSLDIQPQRIATIQSIIPWFADGVISFHIQLEGPIAQTLVLNATDSLPCSGIGISDANTNMVVIPQTVNNGTSETILPNCLIIAVNMYDPEWITYWVLRLEDGSMFSVLGDNKIHNIDRLDTGAAAALAIRAINSTNNIDKRSRFHSHISLPVERRQIFQIDCRNTCASTSMLRIETDSPNLCACFLDETVADLRSRGLEAPDAYTATMTPECCAAMTCVNNGNKKAVYNMFSRTCWCTTVQYVEVNPSADNLSV